MTLFPAGTPLVAEFTRAARNIRSHPNPFVMAYHPVARLNPYQSLLYARAWEFGVAPVATINWTDMMALPVVHTMGVRSIVHLHWTSGIVGSATDSADAHMRVSDFIGKLRELKSGGVRLLWTVHNRLPHRCPFPDAEVSLRRQLAEIVDVIHIMSESTTQDVRDLYRLPEHKLLRAPHPSYVGAYPMHFDRRFVRYDLGFDDGDFVVGMVGSVQPYKGIDSLLATLSSPDSLPPHYKVVIAGPPGQDEESKELALRIRRHHKVRAIINRLDDQSLARLMTALDVMVLPYRQSLNSGAALLALSFGVPIVAPDIGSFKQLSRQGYCLTYDPEEAKGLHSALTEAEGWVARVDRNSMRQDMARLSGESVSRQFFEDLRRLLRA